MNYAVIDTNIIVSALLSKHDDAATVQILTKVFSGALIPVYSEPILTEYQDVLERKKFKFPLEDQKYLLSAIRTFGILTQPLSSNITLHDIKDLPFYEAANTANCYLVTGNLKHFPNEPYIVTARELLDILAT